MLTLHDATDEIKKVFKWGAILVATVISVVIIFKIGIGIKELFWPTLPPGPEICFGKLPDIIFPPNATTNNFTYSVDTVSGSLPVFSFDRINVYNMILPQPGLKDLSRARERVERIGFTSKEAPVAGTTYRWEDRLFLPKRLDFDILSLGFNYSTDFISNPDVLAATNRPDENGAMSLSQSFLSDMYSFPDTIDTNKTKITFQSIVDGKIVSANNLSDAKLIRVDFFKKDINKIPVFYPHPPFSGINLLIAGGKNGAQVVTANFSNNTVGDKSCTYPVKTIEKAFDDLKAGKGYIGFYNGSSDKIAIKDAFIAYYMEEKTQNYLTPIIVFTGENDFYAYVKAIPDEWMSN